MWLTRYNNLVPKLTQTVSLGMRISNTVPYMAAAHDETLSTYGDCNLQGGFSLIHHKPGQKLTVLILHMYSR